MEKIDPVIPLRLLNGDYCALLVIRMLLFCLWKNEQGLTVRANFMSYCEPLLFSYCLARPAGTNFGNYCWYYVFSLLCGRE